MFNKFKLKRKIAKMEKEIELTNNDNLRYDLAMIYLDGTVLKKNETRALELLKTAANKGHIKAKAFLFSSKAQEIFNRGFDALQDIKDIIQN